MIGRDALWLLLWLVSRGDGGTTGFEVVRPTPVAQFPFEILSTDPSNPLKFNENMDAKFLTTMFEMEPSANGLVEPTPVLAGFQTTDIALPLIGNIPVSNQLTTRPAVVESNVNLLMKPTPVMSASKIPQTDAANPSFYNIPELPKMTTQITEPDSLEPTAVIDVPPASETKPTTVAIMSNNVLDAAPSTGSLIEPSQVSNINPESLLPDVGTPNLKPEKPNKMLSNELDDRTSEDLPPCVCSSYQKIDPTPIWNLVSQVAGNGLRPQLFTPEVTKWNNIRHSPNVYQQIFIAQLNLVVNNLPNLVPVNVQPYY